MKNKYTDKFYCFSPPVMIATFVIELIFIIYNVWRYKFNKLNRLVVLILVLLASFQLAEYKVCRGSSAFVDWSHFGYAAITLLPPLGIHIISTIMGKKSGLLILLGYLSAFGFVLYFALSAHSLTGNACLGNYVIFQVNTSLTWLYALYYYGWVTIGMLLSLKYALQAKMFKQKEALFGFSLGYAAFLIPTTTVNLVDRATLNGIPSIMCGFAVIFAIIVTFLVMPRVAVHRRKHD